MRVLVLTIEEEPPSLKTYENEYPSAHKTNQHISPYGQLQHHLRGGGGAAGVTEQRQFSKLFEDFYKKCLQKAPK